MGDYIKRTDAIEVLNIIAGKMDDDGQVVMKQAADIIRDVVSADVQEVVHARWEDYYTRSGYAHTLCSACKTPPAKSHRVIKLHVEPSDRNDYILTNFCANCGAKMDKED